MQKSDIVGWPEALIITVLLTVLTAPTLATRYNENQAAERLHAERMAACRKGA